jgi:hypothetical protein
MFTADCKALVMQSIVVDEKRLDIIERVRTQLLQGFDAFMPLTGKPSRREAWWRVKSSRSLNRSGIYYGCLWAFR